MKLIIASNNKGKIQEYKDIFEPYGFSVSSQSEEGIHLEVEETGTIAFEEEGTNSFGYDPIFISEDGNGKTTASMPISFKETYSHRAKAVKKLISYLEAR